MRDKISRKFLMILISIFFILLLTFLVSESYLNLKRDWRIQEANSRDMIDQRITSLLSDVEIFPQNIGNNLLFLTRLSSLKSIVNGETSSAKELEADFLEFIKEDERYYQLIYTDENGEEKTRVEFNGNQYSTADQNQLENIKDSDDFKATIKLNKGEFYLSQIGLNKENGGLENRGTEQNPSYVPVIKIATPVFNSQNYAKGVVIINLYADYFLEEIRRFQRAGEEVFLIDNKGDYLAHPDREKEFGDILNTVSNFYDDYPEFPEEIIAEKTNKRFESGNSIVSFRHIYPSIYGNFRIPEEQVEKSFWILLIISETDDMENVLAEIKKEHLYFLFISSILVLFIMACVYILFLKSSDEPRQHRRKHEK